MSSLVETLAPSLKAQPTVTVTTGNLGEGVQATAILVASDLPVPEKLGLDLSQLQRAGFAPQVGGVLAFPSSTNPVLVAVGIGAISAISTASIRVAAAAFARSNSCGFHHLIKSTFSPADRSDQHVALVGKGIMYDSGGISLKRGDLSHSQMKNDMTGAGDILAAFTSSKSLG